MTLPHPEVYKRWVARFRPYDSKPRIRRAERWRVSCYRKLWKYANRVLYPIPARLFLWRGQQDAAGAAASLKPDRDPNKGFRRSAASRRAGPQDVALTQPFTHSRARPLPEGSCMWPATRCVCYPASCLRTIFRKKRTSRGMGVVTYTYMAL